ncbi:peptidase M23 [Streptomyces griseoflavus]|uniref:M23 family metallopeptidase n=1 Tax=Streptomyces rimosus TaxID=1927 RepID=UPI0004CA10E9|nr:M23 family metallopeptidase [Streptomyces rimosus]KOG64294.1 peptidase M23 [Streptomyces griseoflavus]KWT57861.1 peptidase M23 [Streptomyces albus subsp. albus]
MNWLRRRLLLHGVVPTAIGTILGLAAAEAVPAVAAGPWTRPIAAHARISSPYGVKGDWAAGHHTGVDFAVRTGTPVSSVGSGTVILAKRSGDYGLAVTIHMTDGYYTLFGHLSRITARVGQRVRAGTRIGYSGATGRTTGPHLHFEVRRTRHYGSDINPLSYLSHRGIRITKRAHPH